MHGRRREADFDEPELRVFEWVVGHLARGIDYRRTQRQLQGLHLSASLTGPMVLAPDGSILAIDEEAKAALERLGPDSHHKVPGLGDPPRIWRIGMDAFVVRTLALPPASLLATVPTQPADATIRTYEARLHRQPGAEKVVVLVEPIE